MTRRPGPAAASHTGPRRPALEIRPNRKAVISIRTVVTMIALSTITAAVIGVGLVMERNARNALTAEVETRLMLQTRNLAQASTATLLGEFPELTLHPLAKEMAANQTELGLVAIVDHKNIVQGHVDSRLLGTEYQPTPDLVPKPTAETLGEGESLMMNPELLVATAPVTYNGRTIGLVHLGLKREYINDLITRSRSQAMVLVTGISLFGVIVTLIVVTILLKPIDALRSGLERIGRGDLETPLNLRGPTELGVLAETVNNMASALKSARDSMIEKERLEHELTLAREIQESLIPEKEIRAGSFLIEGTQEPASEVGGDFYDYALLPGGRIGMAVADVAGKGLAGCMVMSMLSVLLHALKDSYTSPSELLAALDENLIDVLRSDTFITMFYGILDPGTGELVYASAGHCPTLIYHHSTGKVDSKRTTGIPVGAIRGGAIRKTLKDYRVKLEPGDMLIQYTDGINEAFNPDHKQFGMDRLADAVSTGAPDGCDRVMREIKNSLVRWQAERERSDDETLLVVSRLTEAHLAREENGKENLEKSLRDLDRARKRGKQIELPARLEELSRLQDWLKTCDSIAGLDESEFQTLHSALYEACANIIEHGFQSGEEAAITLWSLPDPTTSRPRFYILDRGRVFDPTQRETVPDFNQEAVRRQGRGFGLDIIHRAMIHVDYHASTPAGNLTVLVFDPDRVDKERTLRYA